MAVVEWAFMPFWIPLFAIVSRPEYQATSLASIAAALIPAIGNTVYTATSVLIVNFLFRGVSLTSDQRSQCNRLKIAAAMFIMVIGIYGIAEGRR